MQTLWKLLGTEQLVAFLVVIGVVIANAKLHLGLSGQDVTYITVAAGCLILGESHKDALTAFAQKDLPIAQDAEKLIDKKPEVKP